MTVAGIVITDPDSQDAASDIVHFTEDYGSYCQRRADELAEENGWSIDVWDEDGFHPRSIATEDPEPEPPSPAAPALRALPQTPCTLCRGFGVYSKYPTVCWLCGGNGDDPEPVASAPVSDRTEHFRRLRQSGGMTTYLRYGANYYRIIGKAGYAATVARHGEQYARDILRAKGWQPRRPDLLGDLRAGRVLADLANAA